MHPMLIVAIVGLVLILAAWGLWALVRSWDRTNAVLASAPALPIKLLNVWDPAWLRGDIECKSPCVIPHFDRTCIHYTYKLEEHVQKTRRTSDGKTETYWEWETRETDSGFASFRIVQGPDSIEVAAEQAKWHYELSDSETLGKWRHSCSYIPYPGEVTAVGVVGETKQTMEPLKHVPLIVTPLTRAKYLESAESAERWTARGGLVLLLIGFCVFTYGLIRFAQTSEQPDAEPLDLLSIILGVLIGIAATTLFWTLRIYNSLVIFRTRCEQSWSSINVQLKQRYDLIPNLVEVVKGYLQHEREVLEELASIRNRAMGGAMAERVAVEGEAVQGLSRFVAIVERYPNLKANEQFRKLADQMIALEEKIAHARTFFNDSVTEYNTHTAVFPSNLVANLFAFRRFPMFAAELEERGLPRISMEAASESRTATVRERTMG